MNEKYRMSVAIAAAMFSSLSVFASIEFETAGASLRLSEKRGAIESLVAADGAERLAPSAEAFTLQLLDGKGEPTRLKSSDFVFDLGRAASMMPPQSAVSSKPPYLTWPAGAHAMFYHHLVAFAAILAGGWVTDRFVSRFPRFRLGFQICALLLGAPAIFLIGRCGTFAAAMAITAAYGLFRGVNTHASVFDVVPARHRASVVGFMLLLAMGIGALFSGELMGWVFETFGERSYSRAFAPMAGTYALAALLMSISFFFTFSRDRIAE